MNIHSSLSGQLAYERQRDMIAQASRERLAREARVASRAARRAASAKPRAGRLSWRARPAVNPS